MIHSKELQIGKAGEYLVCSDLITKGLIAFPSEQGLPYDVVIDNGKRLLKCQVKTTTTYRKVPQRNQDTKCYIFNVKRHGNSNNLRHYNQNEVDVFALVFLDVKKVGYVKNEEMPATLNIRVTEFQGKYHDEQGLFIYEAIQDISKTLKTQTEIAKALHVHISTVNRMMKQDYKPFITQAKYPEDYERNKEWFDNF